MSVTRCWKHAEQRAQSVENRIADAIAGWMQFVHVHVIWFAAWRRY
jgi:hypothetical protein